MQINENMRLKTTETLLLLERGTDELILTDYVRLRPLYIKKGKKYILEFLKKASELETYGRILQVFPHEKELLSTFLHHEILVPLQFKRPKLQDYSPNGPDLNHKRNMTLYLLLYQSCNMGCLYCLNGTRTYQTDRQLRMENEIAFRSVSRCMEDISPGGRLEIIFFGGEPLLNWSLAKETILYCEKSLKEKHPGKGIVYQFTSNLSFLPSDLIEWAKKFNISFLCDVDGPEDIHDLCRPFKDGKPTHQAITQNIQRLRDAGLRVDLRATITALNQERLLETTEHHKRIGGNSSAFVPVNPVNSDEDILPESLLPSPQKIINGMIQVYESKTWEEGKLYPFNQYAERFRSEARMALGCGAPFGNTPIVDVNGDVYPCIYLVGMRRFHMGNIMSEDYPHIKIVQKMYDGLHVDRMDDCKACSWRYMCGGGCPLWRLTVQNNNRASAGVIRYCKGMSCDYTKRIIEVVLWDKAKETASKLMDDLRRVETKVDANTIYC